MLEWAIVVMLSVLFLLMTAAVPAMSIDKKLEDLVLEFIELRQSTANTLLLTILKGRN
jgi:hypothetical protein